MLFYGLLYLVYSRFYNLLGAAPEEVGLGYGNIFLRSLGLLGFFLMGLLLVLFTYLLGFANRLLKRPSIESMSRADLEWVLKYRSRLRDRKMKVPGIVRSLAMIVLTPAIVIALIYSTTGLAESYAQLVQSGIEVTPPRIGPIMMLDVRANPVSITWTGVANPEQKALLVHRLMDLGQSGGSVILYDSTTQRLLRIPSGSVVLMAANCEASAPLSKAVVTSNCGQDYLVSRPGVDLQGARLYRHELIRANLQDTNLQKADLRQAYLAEANPLHSNMREADLRDALLAGANLQEANLRAANLQGTIFFRANLRDADLRAADLRLASFTGADLRGADLRGARIESVSLYKSRADGRTRWPKGFDPKRKGVTFVKG
jgi:hypothetical protein